MAFDTVALPYGIRDIKITPYTDAAGSVLSDTVIDLPNGRTLSFSDTEEFQELRGDDHVVTVHGNGSAVDWSLESGGLPFTAFKAMAGGTITESGVTPTQQKIFAKKVTDQRPYFKVEGQAISDSGGDIHVILHRCKATGALSGEFTDGDFFLTAADGQALAALAGAYPDEIYRFVHNETAVGISMAGEVPVISTITPAGAAATQTVTISGFNLTGTTGVMFGAVAGTAVTVISNFIATVVVPTGTAGVVNVVVTNAAGASVAFPYTRA